MELGMVITPSGVLREEDTEKLGITSENALGSSSFSKYQISTNFARVPLRTTNLRNREVFRKLLPKLNQTCG
jgi:hypothetical protein